MAKYSESADRRVGLTLEALSSQATASNTLEDRPGVVSVLKFDVAGECFAVSVDQTEGVVDCPRISPLPAPPDGLIGIASVRGRMTLVMDLSLGASQQTERRRLILLKGEAQLGLLADRVEGVLALPPKSIRKRVGRREAPEDKSAPEQKRSWPASLYFKDRGRLVPVLDIQALSEE